LERLLRRRRANARGDLCPFRGSKVASFLQPIPRVCHQTHRFLNAYLESIRTGNKERNPTVEFIFYDHDAVYHFLRTEMPADVVSAYLHINPEMGAARADFFRYCVMLRRGGVYLDIKSELTVDLFETVITEEDTCVLDHCRDHEGYRRRLGYCTYEQWLLIAAPGHPYFAEVVTLIARRIFSGSSIPPMMPHEDTDGSVWNKQKVLRSTGPDVFAVAIHSVVVSVGLLHREVDFGSIATLGSARAVMYDSAHPHYSELDGPVFLSEP
jgi:hypothetical protein